MSDFTITKTNEGFRVRWKRRLVPGKAWDSQGEARAYAERLDRRYPNGSMGVILGDYSEKPLVRTKEGPWPWTLSDGQTGVIQTGRKSDAQIVLRHQQERRRLPVSIKWELAA